jgi:serine/threonine protein kinase
MSGQSTIAHYRITSKLGDGGMGAVYRATDTKVGKILPDSIRSQRCGVFQNLDRSAR